MSRQGTCFQLKMLSLISIFLLCACDRYKVIEKEVCPGVILRNFHRCFGNGCDAFSAEISRQEMIASDHVIEVEATDFQIVDAFCGCERVFVVGSFLTESGYRRSLVLVEPGDRKIGRDSPSLTDLRELDDEPIEQLECTIDGNEAAVLIRYYDPELDDLETMNLRTTITL